MAPHAGKAKGAGFGDERLELSLGHIQFRMFRDSGFIFTMIKIILFK